MGCGSSHTDSIGAVRISTVTGRLKVTVSTAHVDYDASVFKMDPYIILKLSNQVKQTKVAVKADKSPNYMETFQFHINSCYKVHGRNLEMLMMDKKKIGADNQVGFGIVDLDPVVNFKKPREQFRCFLSHGRKNAGFVNIITEFTEEPDETLSFRFETASIRRKTGFGDMQCRVRITVGEQVLLTSLQKDTKESPPVWKDQILTFTLTKSIKECQIQVLNVNEIIGSTKMSIEDLLSTKTQQSFNEEFQFEDRVNAGSIKFNTLVGQNPVFSEIKVSYKKKKPEQKKPEEEGEKKKEEENKKQQEKKEEKKEEKKQQDKKEEKKEQGKDDSKQLKIEDVSSTK